MKKLLILFIVFVTNSMVSQNLTLDELVKLRNMRVIEVEEYLTLKNWYFVTGDSSDFKGSYITFGLNKNKLSKDRAEAYLNYIYSDSEDNRLGLVFTKKEAYLNFINDFKRLNLKLISSEISESSIVKIYQGKTTTFKMILEKIVEKKYPNSGSLYLDNQTEEYDQYFLSLYTNKDYDLNIK